MYIYRKKCIQKNWMSMSTLMLTYDNSKPHQLKVPFLVLTCEEAEKALVVVYYLKENCRLGNHPARTTP